MSDTPTPTQPPVPTPTAIVERQPRRFSKLWIAPLLALACMLGLLYLQVRAERGPTVTITFADAAGLEIGAKLIHRGLRVGAVKDVRLDTDLRSVIVEAEFAPHAEGLAAEGTQFWIVRPEVSLDRVSGLDTLLGPRYIAVRPLEAPGKPARRFAGLTEPPRLPQDSSAEGFPVRLNARSASSISTGSAVLYRGILVGRVVGLRLAGNAASVEIDAIIEPRYAPLVRDNTRFWDASGVGVDFGIFRGLSVAAGPLDSVLRGAVGLATPTKAGEPAAPGASFELAPGADPDWLEWQPEIAIGE